MLTTQPFERARRVRELAAALAEALDDYPGDVTHFEARSVLGELLDRVGVQGFVTSCRTRTWTFADGVVEERLPPSSPGRYLGVAVERVGDAANEFGNAIMTVDPTVDDAVVALRLALRGLLDQARVQVPEAWEAAVLHEVGALIRGSLRRGRTRVTEGVLDVLVENGALTATLMPDSQAELEHLWGAVEVEGWFAPGPPDQASSGFRTA